MKWLFTLVLFALLGAYTGLFLEELQGGPRDAWAVPKDEAERRMFDHGTATAFAEVACGTSTTVLTAAQTANGVRMLVRNTDATNAATLCPGVTCAAVTTGMTLAVSSATVYVPPIVIESPRAQTFTCFAAAGNPIIEVWLEKIE